MTGEASGSNVNRNVQDREQQGQQNQQEQQGNRNDPLNPQNNNKQQPFPQ